MDFNFPIATINSNLIVLNQLSYLSSSFCIILCSLANCLTISFVKIVVFWGMKESRFFPDSEFFSIEVLFWNSVLSVWFIIHRPHFEELWQVQLLFYFSSNFFRIGLSYSLSYNRQFRCQEVESFVTFLVTLLKKHPRQTH